MSNHTPSALQAFKELEQTGWEEGTSVYDALVGTFTQQAVDRLLDAAHDVAGSLRLMVSVLGLGHGGPGISEGREVGRS